MATGRRRLAAHLLVLLGAALLPGVGSAQSAGAAVIPLGEDAIVFQLDDHGRPILPDLEAARQRRIARTLAGNELTFTFNSPSEPWDPSEIAALTAALDDFYPTAKAIYGPPAFNITVNVRKSSGGAFVGEYNPSLNEMVLQNSVDLTVLCHEMIHAFRDDFIITLPSYEEGMTRAAEVEVFNQLAAYTHSFDEHHSYTYDVYYEA